MKQNLFNKEKEAIKFIKKAESLAMRMSDKGFHVAFSGGKDSQVLLALMELSGCKYHAEMQVTSVDSPNLMRFVRANYPQVKLNLPKKNMRQLIIQKKVITYPPSTLLLRNTQRTSRGGVLYLCRCSCC